MNTLCPQCGPAVAVDDDGCCGMCGALATGEGVDRVAQMLQFTFSSELRMFRAYMLGLPPFERVESHKAWLDERIDWEVIDEWRKALEDTNG